MGKLRHIAIGVAVSAGALMLAANADAAVFVYAADLSGLAEAPPNASPGTGEARVTFDSVAHSLRVQVTFSGLLGTTTAAHIHAPTAVAGAGTIGVATQTPTFSGFPLGVTSGVYDNSFNTLASSTYNTPFLNGAGSGTAAGAETALFNALNAGRAYLNVHSNVFPGGEIRGFLLAVPEPSTWAMMIGGGGLVGSAIRRRRSLRARAACA